jgi:membrane associated rhomboid family serine protease
MDSPITLVLVAVNAIAYFIVNPNKNIDYFERFAEWPYQIIHNNRYYQILSSAFLHANLMHLLFNMFALFTFGSTLERFFNMNFDGYTGSLYFALIYTISLFAGSILTLVFHFNNPDYVAVGASGAVSGIVFSYIIFFPTSTLYVFFVPMPAFVFALLWIAFSIYGMKSSRLGKIGHEAHLGGAVGGVVATLLLIDGATRVLLNHFNAL